MTKSEYASPARTECHAFAWLRRGRRNNDKARIAGARLSNRSDSRYSLVNYDYDYEHEEPLKATPSGLNVER